MNFNKLITLWGNSGSGKTSISAKLALKLANKGLNTILILADDNSFPLGLMVNNYDKSKSIGHLLNANIVDDQMIPFEMITRNIQVTTNSNIGILSYMLGETKENYVEYDSNIANTLINRLLANPNIDCVLVDCASNIIESMISKVAIARADRLFYIASTNIKSLSYLDSYIETVNNLSRSFYHEIVLNDVHPNDPVDSLEKRFKNVKYTVPNSNTFRYQLIERMLLEPLSSTSKKDRKINKTLDEICNTILEGDEN